MKIVVAVDSDKKTIVKKTGQAEYFAIYENGTVVDFIKNNHGDGHHGKDNSAHKHMQNGEHVNEHKKGITSLVGCDIILVQAVGQQMKEALVSIGLEVKKIRKKDGIFADEAVNNFLNNNI